ncbi:HAD-IB family phosphatase [Acidimicrobiia bacterium EGI L10123]|uniref:HAD-IB family phosphatase n=1 Tax=Salinilacustrithrix flava TaxID=2957203 RepID=UPI003D7C31EF|nr:HAD-IB family phosphatase [Acidimicrobiia bacterium EGI L10123]
MPDLSIAAALDGQRIAITGGTGFLGTALIERLLRRAPGCELVLLIRPSQRRSVGQRARREIFKNDAFDLLREQLAGSAADGGETFDDMIERRVRVIGGDVSSDGLGLDEAGREVLATCDTVIHSAATVSFDSPLDLAVEVNLLGPSRIASTLHDICEPSRLPHLVAVSTCYVAGNRKGAAPEEPVDENAFWFGVDWRKEVAASRRSRADFEAESRRPDMLARFRKEARRELGAAGAPLLAAKTEQRRSAWVSDQLVEAGRTRAASLGWPDAYAYTKALGEKALFEHARSPVTGGSDLPFSIVRPAIIESSLAEPSPGWIRGFRMAEPVIISYARGLLKEFPGVPEGIIDVIPVDLVCGAICAVAADGPARNDDGTLAPPRIVQSASGSANPLRYRRLVDNVRSWFTEHPVYDSDGQPIVVPEWNFPGRGRVQAQLERAKSVIEKAESTLQALPLRGRQAEWASNLESKREDVERALTYVELYGAYAECEAVYGVENLLDLHQRMDEASREAFGLDPRVIDWDRYVSEIHLPSVVQHARVKTTPGSTDRESRSSRLRRQVLSPDRHVAAFDLENTIIASNVVASYSWLATRRLPPEDRLRFVLRTLAEAPSLLSADRKDRSDFLRQFYRRYEGAPVDQLDADTVDMFSHLLLTKSFPAAIRRVREHRALGHRTLLITGALDVAIKPIMPLFDDVICAEMTVAPDGTYTGELTDVPPTGEARAQALFDYCDLHGLDPAESVAYADSTSDLPLLEAAGFPVAVNPEARLSALARKRGWLVEHFDKAKGGSHPLLPIGPSWNQTTAVATRTATSGRTTGGGS